MEERQAQWLAAIRSMTATPDDAAKYLDGRLRFTTAVARALTHDEPQRDELVYGVWLNEHSAPIYVGQTNEGRRRLWDLPIGESHHLANSFPPEIWGRVVVVYWGQLLDARSEFSETLAAEIQLSTGAAEPRAVIGLGLEYLLQSQVRPLFNRRKKRRDGSWRDVCWEMSSSLGARAAPHLSDLFTMVTAIWNSLGSISPSTQPVLEHSGGRVVFPSRILSDCHNWDVERDSPEHPKSPPFPSP